MTSSALWTSIEVLKALGCDREKDGQYWEAFGISIDTRTLKEGDIFFAISGPNFDGHDFVSLAFQKGAVAAIITHDPGNCGVGSPLLFVNDVTEALQKLGTTARGRLKGKVIAVTGSVGKTGTKEMLRLAFGALGCTEATIGNQNNHLGLPLNLSRVPTNTEYIILELGMSHPGEIRILTRIARPHVVIITAIEQVHMMNFDSLEGIAKAKAEIFEGIEPNGTAVINYDSPYFNFLEDAARNAGVCDVISFGRSGDADVQLQSVDLAVEKSSMAAKVRGDSVFYHIGAPGLHLAINSLSVLGAVQALNGNLSTAANALCEFVVPRGRGEHVLISLMDGDLLLIDESYNASPSSVTAAMTVVGAIQPEPGGRRIAILGDMLELGDSSGSLHSSLLNPLNENKFDLVFTVGQEIQCLWEELPEDMRGGHSVSPEKLSLVVNSAVNAGDVVMVKGSLGSRVGVIVEGLRGLDINSAETNQKIVNVH